MAEVTTHLLASPITPVLDVGLYNVNRTVDLAADVANNGDYIPLFTVQRDGRIVGCQLAVDATLGAGCTVKAALYRAGASVRDLTIATTAGGSSKVNSTTLGPIDCQADDEVVLVVGGADTAAAAEAQLDVQLQH